MNAPVMNKMQLCGAESGAHARSERAHRPATRSAGLPQGARRAAVPVLAAAVLAVGAAAWLAVSHEAPLPIVELSRVVIVAPPPGTCPVPVEPPSADCPVPFQDAQAAPAGVAVEPSLESSPSRSTQR